MTTPTTTRRAFLRTTLGVLATPALLSCDFSPFDNSGNARLTARPGLPTGTPTKGAVTELGLGASRDGVLYVPESYEPERAMPLFVALHGAGGRGSDWASYPNRAEERGFIFMAPDSRGSTWDVAGGIGFGPDVPFLDRALGAVFAQCRVDPSRIALGGFSDGASYALSLGVANGDLFSHLVAYSPGFWAPGEPRTGRPRMFVSHGEIDTTLSYSHTEQDLVPRLRKAGYDVTFRSFFGGHEVPADVSEAALGWFLGA